MIDIVDRLRFDAIRCELQFSEGVAGNITEAADEIGRQRAQIEIAYREFDAEKAEITGKLFDQINENKKLRSQLDKAKRALAWIDNHDPELVDAALAKFEISLIDETSAQLRDGAERFLDAMAAPVAQSDDLGCSSAVEQDAVNVLVAGSSPAVPANREKVFELIYSASSYNMTADAAEKQTNRIIKALENASLLSLTSAIREGE